MILLLRSVFSSQCLHKFFSDRKEDLVNRCAYQIAACFNKKPIYCLKSLLPEELTQLIIQYHFAINGSYSNFEYYPQDINK